jgi:hypothetical protein
VSLLLAQPRQSLLQGGYAALGASVGAHRPGLGQDLAGLGVVGDQILGFGGLIFCFTPPTKGTEPVCGAKAGERERPSIRLQTRPSLFQCTKLGENRVGILKAVAKPRDVIERFIDPELGELRADLVFSVALVSIPGHDADDTWPGRGAIRFGGSPAPPPELWRGCGP